MRPRRAGLMLLYLLVSLGAAASAQPVTIVTEEWAPYNYTENGQLTGYSTEIVEALLARLGRHDAIQLFPGDRGMNMLLSGPRTMMFSILRTPERERKFWWLGPIGEASVYFYQRKGSTLSIRTLDDAKRVGTVACRSAGLVFDKLRTAGFTNLDATTTKAEGVYLKLLTGRCDLAISDSPLGVAYFLRKAGLPRDSLVQTPVALIDALVYLAASRDISSSEIMGWQRALDQIRAEGLIERIQKHYLNGSAQ